MAGGNGTTEGNVPALLQLELTGRCNLRCTHCSADSGPGGSHGVMTPGDWEGVITQAATAGVRAVQFIGGEPTMHPDLPRLVRHALGCGLRAIVYSNLTHVTEGLWDLFQSPGVSLSTSWYAADAATHARITGNRTAWAGTRASIARAVRLGVPVRVAIVAVEDGQDTAAAEASVRALGVTRVSVRPVQGLGRAAGDAAREDPGQLCGHCGDGIAAVLPDGRLTPCAMARWLTAGDARSIPLGGLLGGEAWRQAVAQVPRRVRACQPDGDADNCSPDDETICPLAAAELAAVR